MCMSACECLWRPEGILLDTLELGLLVVVSLLRLLETKSSPLREQPVLLTIGPYLQGPKQIQFGKYQSET